MRGTEKPSIPLYFQFPEVAPGSESWRDRAQLQAGSGPGVESEYVPLLSEAQFLQV